MLTTFSPSSVSTHVAMRMLGGGMELPVAQMASDFIILRDAPSALPVSAAEIIMEVDGEPTRFPVFLPQGLIAGERRTAIASAQ